MPMLACKDRGALWLRDCEQSSSCGRASTELTKRTDVQPDREKCSDERDEEESSSAHDISSSLTLIRGCVKTPRGQDARKNRRSHFDYSAFLFLPRVI